MSTEKPRLVYGLLVSPPYMTGKYAKAVGARTSETHDHLPPM